MKCGNKQCACHRDPAKRHRPYLGCTYKVHNKTVNLKLYPKVSLYRAAIQQHRKLKSRLVWNAYRESPWRIGPDRCNPAPPLNENPGYSHILPSSPYPAQPNQPNRLILQKVSRRPKNRCRGYFGSH